MQKSCMVVAMSDASPLARAIEVLGGPSEFMAAIDISPRTLASWRKFGVPDTRWGAVARATGGKVDAGALAAERAAALAAAPTPAQTAA